MDVSGITQAMASNATNSKASAAADSLKSSAQKLNSSSSEEELKGVLKDFESYFVEQVLKQAKESLTLSNDDDEDSGMSQYKDMYMDNVIEEVSDKIVDSMGDNLTQQLYEQMKRNYNID